MGRGQIRWVGVGIIALLLPLAARAEQHHHSEVGKVTKIEPDAKDKTWTDMHISSHGHEICTIRVAPKTPVTKGGEAAALSDIKVNDYVNAEVDDDEVASKIQIQVPRKK